MDQPFVPLDIAWMLLCAALVMLMQAGFCLLESGLVRAKNSINVAIKNLADFCVSSVMFWIVGFGLMFGASAGGWLGSSDFLLGAEHIGPWLLAFFTFQLVFCSTATTIISGAVAERMRFGAFLVIAVVTSAVIYPVFGHWAWGGAAGGEPGWLASMGFIDFAGSTVVHSVGAWVALAVLIQLGPRIGRFDKDAPPIQGHNLPMAVVGVLLLWFGWFGFNGGSTLAVNSDVPLILVNTSLSAAFGGATGMLLAAVLFGRPDTSHLINGVIAGLVGITAGCHIVTPLMAAIVGVIASALCMMGVMTLARLRIDDAVSAVPAHGLAGVWGTLAVALLGDPAMFAEGMSRWSQLGVQLLGVGVAAGWAFGVGWAAVAVTRLLTPIRIDAEGERQGLNVAEHNASTALLDLLRDMNTHREQGVFTQPVTVEPHTEVGQIADEYNRVLKRVESEFDQRRAALTELEAAKEKYRSIFENAFEGIYQTSRNGRFLSANPKLAQILGYESPEALRRHASVVRDGLYVESGRREAFCQAVEREGAVRNFVSQVRRADGSTTWISENARVVRDDRGEVLCYEGAVEDISERLAQEALREQINEAEAASKAKSEFLANMSHEIRTPLNGVIGMLELLANTSMSTQQQRYASIARASASTLLSLINDILDFSKIEAGKLELDDIDFNLVSTVEDVVEMLTPQVSRKGLEFACHIAADAPRTVKGDPDRLRQILINLANNAIKFTEAGEVVIDVATVSSSQSGCELRFEVRDTGIGIPADRADSLFDSFTQVDRSTTRKYGGTGLGLAISRQLAELMGGAIGVESVEGEGSTFWFTAHLGIASGGARDDEGERSGLSGLRALVVDDNGTNLDILVENFTHWGLSVMAANSAAEGLHLLDRARAQGQPFELLVTDMHMPEMDGVELIERIRSDAQLDPLVIVLLTSIDNPLTSDQRRDLNVARCLTKPARQSQLYDALMDSCARFGAHRDVSAAAEHRTAEDAASLIDGLRVLVAEDNEVNQLVATELLTRAGCAVTVVGDGRAAIKTLRSEVFDLVLMDCQMPDVDGFQATALIREHESSQGAVGPNADHLPIIALTANAVRGDRERCLQAGMDDYVSKPIDAKLLFAAMAQLVAGRQPQSASQAPAAADVSSGAATAKTSGRPTPSEPGAREDDASTRMRHVQSSDAASESAPVDRPANDDEPINMAELLERCLGSGEIALRVLDKFEVKARMDAESLGQCMEADDREALSRLAHAVKGAAANLGAGPVRKAAEKLEQVGADARDDDLRKVVERLRTEVDRCLAYIPTARKAAASAGKEAA